MMDRPPAGRSAPQAKDRGWEVGVMVTLSHDEQAKRHLPSSGLGHAHHRRVDHVWMGHDDVLQSRGGQPMAGHVDDVIVAGSHVHVTVLVPEARVHRVVVALRTEGRIIYLFKPW